MSVELLARTLKLEMCPSLHANIVQKEIEQAKQNNEQERPHSPSLWKVALHLKFP